MINWHTRFSKKTLLLLLGDVLLLYVALFITLFLRHGPVPIGHRIVRLHLTAFTPLFVMWLLAFGASGLYELRSLKRLKVFFYRLLRVMAINIILAVAVFYLLPLTIEPRRNLITIAAITIILVFLWRYIFVHMTASALSSRIVLVGEDKEHLALARHLYLNPHLGHRPVALISAGARPQTLIQQIPHYKLGIEDLAHCIKKMGTDAIVISRGAKDNKAIVNTLYQLIPAGIAVVEFPTFHEMLTGKIPLSLIEEMWFLENLIGIRKPPYEFFKRFLDIILAVVALAGGALAFPPIALAIKLDSPGPIVFRQKRVGRHGRVFELIKFRSMVEDAEILGGLKENDAGCDTRHTRVGAFLRKSYLDELPQIINILRGEMSFIGPRPERPEYVEELKQKIPFYEMRLLVSPGITGWAQTNMKNDASVEDALEKMQYDLYYVKNRSFVLDLLIILKTIATILQRQGR